jgi:hypothetical protein
MTYNKGNRETPSVEKLIPQQLVGNSTALIEFLKEYYKFLNKSGESSNVINHIIENKDLDKAVDSYVDMVRKELSFGLPSEIVANKINLYKHIGEFYRAKGSIESFKLLFRLLFNKNVEISLPKEQILVASDGRWVQQNALFATIAAGNPFDLVDTFVDIINPNGSIVRVEVQRVRKHDDSGTYEISIDRFFRGTISNNATFNSNGVTGTIITALSGFTIDYPGRNFKVGQLLDVIYGLAVGTKIKVTSVDSNGGITGLEFLSFGIDYPEEFTSQLVPVGFDYTFGVEETTPGDPSALTYSAALNDQLKASEFLTVALNPYVYDSEAYFGEIYLEGLRIVGQPVSSSANTGDVNQSDLDEDDDELTLQEQFPNRAIVTFFNTALSKYAGAYSTNKGFLSDDIYLQDNLYYQQFSYVIKTDEQFKTYENFVKQAVHPSGMIVFGEFEITTELDASRAMAILEMFFRQDFIDVIRTETTEFSKVITKPLEDEIITSQFVYYEFTKVLEDSSAAIDDYSYELTKVKEDSILSVSNIESFSLQKPLISEAEASDGNIIEDPLVVYALDYFKQDYSEGLTVDSSSGFNYILNKGFGADDIVLATDGENSTVAYSLNYFAQNYSEGVGDGVERIFTKSLNDSALTVDQLSYNTTKAVIDNTAIDDTNYIFNVEKIITDTTTSGDDLSISLEKDLEDDINIVEGGAVEINPYSPYYFSEGYTDGLYRAIS